MILFAICHLEWCVANSKLFMGSFFIYLFKTLTLLYAYYENLYETEGGLFVIGFSFHIFLRLPLRLFGGLKGPEKKPLVSILGCWQFFLHYLTNLYICCHYYCLTTDVPDQLHILWLYCYLDGVDCAQVDVLKQLYMIQFDCFWKD